MSFVSSPQSASSPSWEFHVQSVSSPAPYSSVSLPPMLLALYEAPPDSPPSSYYPYPYSAPTPQYPSPPALNTPAPSHLPKSALPRPPAGAPWIPPTGRPARSAGLGVGIGVAVAVFLLLVFVAVLVLRRRRWWGWNADPDVAIEVEEKGLRQVPVDQLPNDPTERPPQVPASSNLLQRGTPEKPIPWSGYCKNGKSMAWVPPHAPRPSSIPQSQSTRSTTSFPPNAPLEPIAHQKGTFTYEELYVATDGFSNGTLVGEGAFGYVHKGVLANGKQVAVKQPKANSPQTERESQAELEILGRVHHKHLVSLLGYCIAADKRLLVYDFVPNNTLAFHLHGTGEPTMNWSKRMRVATGAAKGIAYLHDECQPRIIHRDIKASNIFLDAMFNAKVGDFGLAKLFPDEGTHVISGVVGTLGYMPPEYLVSPNITEKLDVYSYGVVLLELITGRLPVDNNDKTYAVSLADWARPLLDEALKDDGYHRLADKRLQGRYNVDEMARMAACAAACIRIPPNQRPTMPQIVRILEDDKKLNAGSQCGQGSFYTALLEPCSDSGTGAARTGDEHEHE